MSPVKRWKNRSASLMPALIMGLLVGGLATAVAADEGDSPQDSEEAQAPESDEQEESEESELLPGRQGVQYRVDEDQLVVLQDGEEVGTAPLLCSGPAVSDSYYIYVACGERGLLIVSLEEARYPAPLQRVPREQDVESVSLAGNRLWIDYADGSGESIVAHEEFDVVSEPPDTLEISRGDVTDDEEVEPSDDEVAEDDKEELFEEYEEEVAEARDDEESWGYRMAQGPDHRAGTEDRDQIEEWAEDIKGLEGNIIEIRDGRAVINLGKEDGLSENQRIELFQIIQVRIGGEDVEKHQSAGVGRVTTLARNHSEVTLPLNVVVQEGMSARVTTERVTEKPAPRLENILVVDAGIRPFLPIDALGVGALGRFGMAYHFTGPWIFEVRADPIGVTVTDSNTEDIRTFAANAMLSFVGDNFQVGLGTGLSRVHWRVGDRRMDEPPSTQDNLGVGAVQHLRLGRQEDVYLSLTTNFVVVDRAWQFGGAILQGEAPAQRISENMWYLGRVGGGVPGHFLVEFGLRQLVAGNGGPGSIFITPTVGVGHIARDIYEPQENTEGEIEYVRTELGYTGPMIGFGVEWRQ